MLTGRQREARPMITFIAHIRVKPENVAAYEELMTYVRDKTHENEPGVLYYEFSRSVADPELWVVVEVYKDTEVHAAHMASPWVRDSIPKSSALISGYPEIKQYVNGGSEPVRGKSVFNHAELG
jgi:quinol monooxygenase YgiN